MHSFLCKLRVLRIVRSTLRMVFQLCSLQMPCYFRRSGGRSVSHNSYKSEFLIHRSCQFPYPLHSDLTLTFIPSTSQYFFGHPLPPTGNTWPYHLRCYFPFFPKLLMLLPLSLIFNILDVLVAPLQKSLSGHNSIFFNLYCTV
jgi:hypothetical protein